MPRTNGSDDYSHDLTKRESAAIQAMSAIIASGVFNPEHQMPHIVSMAVSAADALFDELVKE